MPVHGGISRAARSLIERRVSRGIWSVLLPAALCLILAVAVLGLGFAPTPGNPRTSTDEAQGNPAPAMGAVTATVLPVAPSPAVPTAPVQATGARAATPISERAMAAEMTLRSGQFEAVLDYGDGSHVFVTMRFDLGDKDRASRAHVVTDYYRGDAHQISERIIIADRTWQRQTNGQWMARTQAQAHVDQQVAAFLPHVPPVAGLQMTGGIPSIISWYNASRDADVTLDVDPATGIPRYLRQVSRTTSTLLTVTYSGWNTEVSIPSPGSP